VMLSERTDADDGSFQILDFRFSIFDFPHN
jgi:hypothetical protein